MLDYEEAKNVVRNFFKGIDQSIKIVTEAFDIISEKDYRDIQNEQNKISTV